MEGISGNFFHFRVVVFFLLLLLFLDIFHALVKWDCFFFVFCFLVSLKGTGVCDWLNCYFKVLFFLCGDRKRDRRREPRNGIKILGDEK